MYTISKRLSKVSAVNGVKWPKGTWMNQRSREARALCISLRNK